MALIKLFWDICLFRRGPQDVPDSRLLLGLALAVYLICGLTMLGLEADWLGAVLQVLAETAMLVGFVWITLDAARKRVRLQRTLTAMLGTDALISAMAIPLVMAMGSSSAIAAPGYIVLLMLMLWHLGVVAHILRIALSRPFGFGLGLALVYVLGSYQAMMLLFGTKV